MYQGDDMNENYKLLIEIILTLLMFMLLWFRLHWDLRAGWDKCLDLLERQNQYLSTNLTILNVLSTILKDAQILETCRLNPEFREQLIAQTETAIETYLKTEQAAEEAGKLEYLKEQYHGPYQTAGIIPLNYLRPTEILAKNLKLLKTLRQSEQTELLAKKS